MELTLSTVLGNFSLKMTAERLQQLIENAIGLVPAECGAIQYINHYYANTSSPGKLFLTKIITTGLGNNFI